MASGPHRAFQIPVLHESHMLINQYMSISHSVIHIIHQSLWYSWCNSSNEAISKTAQLKQVVLICVAIKQPAKCDVFTYDEICNSLYFI